MRGEEISALMRSLGSKKSEISIFIYLYTVKKPVSVQEIVDGTGISEKTVRQCLNNLVEKGYVEKLREGKKTLYSARDLNVLLSEFKKKIEEKVSEIFSRLRFPRG